MINLGSKKVKQTQDPRLLSLVKIYRETSAIRPELLFSKFLPTGYEQTTLSSVEPNLLQSVILAKVHLGMIITLFDDLADHPAHRNPDLLEELYGLNLEREIQPSYRFPNPSKERRTMELARYLFAQLRESLQSFPNYERLAPALRFDIEQFYAANRHSELLAQFPSAGNLTESANLGPHNMGIVAAGTIDLMASQGLVLSELGRCREVFLLGQRLGRISNLLFTLKREIAEGDTTNEILIAKPALSESEYRGLLLSEFENKATKIRSFSLETFHTGKYADGLERLHDLHSSLEGRI
ncbi:MAG: hypothetical protein ACXWQO_02570 [Bdellovibrionota bacterium]